MDKAFGHGAKGPRLELQVLHCSTKLFKSLTKHVFVKQGCLQWQQSQHVAKSLSTTL